MDTYFAEHDAREFLGIDDVCGICISTEAWCYYNYVHKLDIYSESISVHTYFCTSCGEIHTVEKSITPVTADFYLMRDCPSWFGVNDYENRTTYQSGICEECSDAFMQDGSRDFPHHDLID